ncbi:hypothetical protein [Terriglobus saanensis]|uniref:Uncharacterized protein n=1 Tax=Terriglobus saanensis (strain ATCC BAA-1853 / DSM 23119 / SP1PR4) TaxID=401053 RepID=E8UYT4_TERSS|nr:hypothetical protein [Terriglobus saanensis]ADV84300.1 hypothetical protein AciPR4_3547 [Terriglobus saanensis SP1PR4]
MIERIDGRTQGANAAVVNRTRRAVRQRAEAMQAQRSRLKDLWLPLSLCSILLMMVCYAVWAVMEQKTESSIPETSMLSSEPGGLSSILLLWLLPVSIAGIAMVWMRRNRSDEATR